MVIANEDIFLNILVKQCLSVLYYGIKIVYLDSNTFNAINKAWNNAFQWLFNYGKYDS